VATGPQSGNRAGKLRKPGYARLLSWLGEFGTVCLAGIEGTGSYGAGLARHVSAAGVRVVEVDRCDRQDRRRQGKITRRPGFGRLPAAHTGRVVAVDGSSYFSRPGPPIIDGLEIMAAIIRAEPGGPLPTGAAWAGKL